jgi:polar amino acid transport system permease protein
MFSFCADPDTLDTARWFACYLTTGKHMAFYASFGTVLMLLAVTAPVALAFGFAGAWRRARGPAAALVRARAIPRWCAACPTSRSFLFFVIALDQALRMAAPPGEMPRLDRADPAGQRFRRLHRGQAAAWATRRNGCTRPMASPAVLTFAIVFGAFAANVLFGAMRRCRARSWKPPKPTA